MFVLVAEKIGLGPVLRNGLGERAGEKKAILHAPLINSTETIGNAWLVRGDASSIFIISCAIRSQESDVNMISSWHLLYRVE